MLYMHEPKISLMGTATVGTKGQIVIPVDAREALGIGPGSRLFIVKIAGKNALGLVPESEMQAMIDRLGSQLDAIKTIVKKD